MLYEKYLELFKKRMIEFGTKKLQADVKFLRFLQRKTFSDCGMEPVTKNGIESVTKSESNDDLRFIPWHKNVIGIRPAKRRMVNRTCVFLAMTEHPFTEYLRQLHIKELSKTRPQFINFMEGDFFRWCYRKSNVLQKNF